MIVVVVWWRGESEMISRPSLCSHSVHLPGENCVNQTYNDMDFPIPVTWSKEVSDEEILAPEKSSDQQPTSVGPVALLDANLMGLSSRRARLTDLYRDVYSPETDPDPCGHIHLIKLKLLLGATKGRLLLLLLSREGYH